MNKKVKKILKDPRLLFLTLGRREVFNWMSDEQYLKTAYKICMGSELDLEDPKTYNEKLQWLKIHDRNPLYTTLVDKYEVKKYVGERIGEDYIVPLLGVWEHFDDIDFDQLPDRFVLKCTHDSGGLVICKDKAKLDKAAAKKKIEHCLKHSFYWGLREWPYKDVKPRIIAEEYLEDPATRELRDYKFFAFDGQVKALFVASERQAGTDTKFDFFDAEYRHLDLVNGHPMAEVPPAKPDNFEKMKELAGILSKGMPQVRVDFYEVAGKVYFGEMTFFHWSGMTPFEPKEWDRTFGDWIRLPEGNHTDSLVSVVIITCKRKKEILKRAVDSALAQSYPNLEIIVVNDYPEDESLETEIKEMLSAYGDERIRYIVHDKNSGACKARNTGIQASKGEFIALLDDDDEWLPEKIEKQMRKFTSDRVGMVYSSQYEIYPDGTKKKILLSQNSGDIYEEVLRSNCIGGCSVPVIRKSVFDQVGLFDEKLLALQDFDLWLRIAKEYEIHYAEGALLNKYAMPDAITYNSRKKMQGYAYVIKKFREEYKKHPSAYNIFLNRYAGACLKRGQYHKFFKLWRRAILIRPLTIKNAIIPAKALVNLLRKSIKSKNNSR